MANPKENMKKVLLGLRERDLSTIPGVLGTLMDVSKDPKTQASDLAAVCEMDKSSSARLLRAANSAYYSTRNQERVDNIKEAIVRIGFKATQEIIMSATVCNLFRANKVIGDYSSTRLWMHSMAVGVGNRIIYSQRFGAEKMDPFVGGLLHDVGISIEHQFLFYDGFPEAIEQQAKNGTLLTEEEEKAMGVTHEQIGEEVARHWNFPDRLAAVLGHHHRMGCQSVEQERLVHVTRLSELICHEMGFGYCDFGDGYAEQLYESQQKLEIDDDTFLKLAEQLKKEVASLSDLGWFSQLKVRTLE